MDMVLAFRPARCDAARTVTVHDASVDGPQPGMRGERAFATTHWSLVVRAGELSAPEANDALEYLCRLYWYPLYAFARRLGLAQADAEDATQGFFAYLVGAGAIARADPARGRFRTFLLTAFRNYLSHERERAAALKRGGGREIVSFDALAGAEDRLAGELAAAETPESMFDRHWALGMLEHVFGLAQREYAAADRAPLFTELKTALWGASGDVAYAVIAERLTMTEGAVKMAALRLRRRVRELLRAEVEKTLVNTAEVDQELRHLMAALAS